MDSVTIKNLYEKIGADEEYVKKLREMRYADALRAIQAASLIVARGGNIHRVNHVATAKRRAANKVARKQRKHNARNSR